jgi:hypothetical protein
VTGRQTGEREPAIATQEPVILALAGGPSRISLEFPFLYFVVGAGVGATAPA